MKHGALSYTPADPSVAVQTSPAYYGFVKAANTVGYFLLLWLSWKFFTHQLDWHLSTGCVVLSGCWLLLTRVKVNHLLQTYFDILSRIELQLPVVLGITLSAIALIAKVFHPYVRILAVIEILAWVYIYVLYKLNQSKYKKQGYGPVPLNTWVNPPASALRPGDLLLTSGNIAKGLHESVGHAELVLEMPDGTKQLFSSYMAKGTIIHPIEDMMGPHYKGYFIGLHLKKPWSKEESDRATKMAEEMVATNQKWAAEENVRVTKRIDFIPLPEKWKKPLRDIFYSTGYDWFGTFMGRIATHRWTCIGAAVELYKRMGVKTNYYGTGLLGFGTTLFDPILPVRFLADPALELITTAEEMPIAASTEER